MLLTFGGGQLLILMLLLIMSVTLSRQYGVESAARERLYESFEARSEIVQLLSVIQDIETGQRGFVITGHSEYLQPYRDALNALQFRLSAVEALLRARIHLGKHLALLKDLIATRVELAGRAIEARQRGTLAQAAEIVSRGDGKRVMDQIRNVVADIQRIEALNLKSAMRTEQAILARSRNLTYGLGGAIAALSVFGGALGYVLVDRRRQAERKAERQRGIVTLLSELADASNNATFEEALNKTLEVVLRDTKAGWGMTVRFDPLKRHEPIVHWNPAPPGGNSVSIARYIAKSAERITGPTLLDLPATCGLDRAVPSCSLVPISDGTQLAGALFIAGPRPGPEDAERQAARLYTAEQLSRAAERQRMLDTLTDTLTRHEALFSSASDGIITINESNTIERVNPAAEALFGYAALEIQRRDFTILIDEPSDPAEGLARKLLIGSGAPDSIAREAIGRRKNGTTFPVEISLSAMHLGERTLFVAFVRDVSERKRVERMQAEFVSTVSHELRTPLTSIGGSLGLIAGGAAGEISERAKRLVEIAHKNTQRLIRLVNDILDIEKLQSGKMSFQFTSLPVDDFLAQVVAANRGFSERFGVEIALKGSGAWKVHARRPRPPEPGSHESALKRGEVFASAGHGSC
jgi:PAS domain S-box-containing protein